MPLTRTSPRAATWSPPPISADLPALMGQGPVECSSCTDLSVLPGVIFDVNGYYRELGVSPTATRKELRIAYQAANGQDSVRLTYILCQLLNPEVRFAYDCTPLGELFLDDIYVQEMLTRKIKERQAQRMADLAKAGVDISRVDEGAILRDIYAEFGVHAEDPDAPDTPSEMVDPSRYVREDETRPAKFPFSYYVWRLARRLDADHLTRLGEWQQVLIRAMAQAGVRTRFAVGLHGGSSHRWVQAQVGYRTVFFLNIEVSPDEELATEVAARLQGSSPLATR